MSQQSRLTSLACLASVLACTNASAGTALYASDFSLNKLVTIDPATGAVSEVGSLAIASGVLVDLASFDGRLFGIVSEYPTSTRLIEIDPHDAEILSDVTITDGGAIAPNAIEALTATANGSLLVSLWQPGALGASSSNAIGTLALDGTVTGVVDYGTGADFDGLGTGPRGSHIGLNRQPGAGRDFVELLAVEYPAGSLSVIIQIPFSDQFNGVDDLVVLDDEILTVDTITHRLNHHDRATGVVTSFVDYPAEWSLYAGLALVSLSEPCSADLDGDNDVDAADLAILLGAWGAAGPADFDGSGGVDAADLAILLGAWGPCG